MTCHMCKQEIVIGMWPFCPHGFGSYHSIPDEVPGGFTVENAWPEPRTFYSQSEYEKALAADGMELRPRHVPGGKLANWATSDPVTLDNGRILAERQAHTKSSKDEAATIGVTWTTRTIDLGAEITVDL